jgi:CrcB protein
MVAGGLGVLLRYGLGRAALSLQWTSLPFGTLMANLIGCFLIGFLSWMLANRWAASEQMQIIVLTGFLGGFTTFSAFSLEAINMFQSGLEVRALLYIALKVFFCILMCLLGLVLAKQVSG